MMRSHLLIAPLLFSIVALLPGCATNNLAGSASVEISSENISPTKLKVDPGTTVVWQNNSNVPVRLKFLEKPISTTCDAARGFNLETKGISESTPIAVGGVASICLLRPQRYDYKIEKLEDNFLDDSQNELKAPVTGFIEVSLN